MPSFPPPSSAVDGRFRILHLERANTALHCALLAAGLTNSKFSRNDITELSSPKVTAILDPSWRNYFFVKKFDFSNILKYSLYAFRLRKEGEEEEEEEERWSGVEAAERCRDKARDRKRKRKKCAPQNCRRHARTPATW